MKDPIFPILELVIRNVVDTPDLVNISTDENEERVVYIVQTKTGEQGQVIGKSGQLLDHLRAILRSVAQKHRFKKVYVEVDPKGA